MRHALYCRIGYAVLQDKRHLVLGYLVSTPAAIEVEVESGAGHRDTISGQGSKHPRVCTVWDIPSWVG